MHQGSQREEGSQASSSRQLIVWDQILIPTYKQPGGNVSSPILPLHQSPGGGAHLHYLAGEDKLTKKCSRHYRINHLTHINVDIEHPDDGKVLIA